MSKSTSTCVMTIVRPMAGTVHLPEIPFMALLSRSRLGLGLPLTPKTCFFSTPFPHFLPVDYLRPSLSISPCYPSRSAQIRGHKAGLPPLLPAHGSCLPFLSQGNPSPCFSVQLRRRSPIEVHPKLYVPPHSRSSIFIVSYPKTVFGKN